PSVPPNKWVCDTKHFSFSGGVRQAGNRERLPEGPRDEPWAAGGRNGKVGGDGRFPFGGHHTGRPRLPSGACAARPAPLGKRGLPGATLTRYHRCHRPSFSPFCSASPTLNALTSCSSSPTTRATATSACTATRT